MSDVQRFRMTVEYDGTDFVGWQMQPNGRSVQEELERATGDLFGIPVRVHGAGRTDAGVHARGQVAHFDAETALDARVIGNALNARLPADIVVRDMSRAAEDFHARFSASSRSYAYSIAHTRVAIDRRSRWILHRPVDHGRIREALRALPGTRDFTTFSKETEGQSHGMCHVFEAEWVTDGMISSFRIRANRFLTGMVRALVGAAVQIGSGRLEPGDMVSLIEACDRGRTPMLAPPHGLVLEAVGYDPDEYAFIRSIMEALRAERDPDCTIDTPEREP